MDLVKDFLKFAKKQKMDVNNIYTEKNKEYSIVSFGQASNEGILYNITFIFYDSETYPSEIMISKPISEEDLLTSLIRANELNVNYMDTTFFINENNIVVKSMVTSYENINIPLKRMIDLLDIANKEFPEFI